MRKGWEEAGGQLRKSEEYSQLTVSGVGRELWPWKVRVFAQSLRVLGILSIEQVYRRLDPWHTEVR